MESLTSVPEANRKKIVFANDYMSRRVRKAVYDWDGATGAYKATTSVGSRFVYDGWNPVAELSLGASVRRTCTWGLDLSGNRQGAGGIGGLIVVKDYTADGKGVYYPAYDGGGNLTGMVKAADGTLAASYEYSPYGELLTSTGDYAGKNPFRFSTKYTDSETGLAYFGYRYYNPDTGRWLNRDPIEERGGANLYAYIRNLPFGLDVLGLYDYQLGSNIYPYPTSPEYIVPSSGVYGSEMPTLADHLLWSSYWALASTGIGGANSIEKTPVASRLLKNFLSQAGDTSIDLRAMLHKVKAEQTELVKEINQALAFSEKVFKSQHIHSFNVVASKWAEANISHFEDVDWNLAVQTYWHKGVGNVTTNGCRYKINFVYHFYDRYAFQPSSDPARLHRRGLAMDFNTLGTWGITVSWCKGERLEANLIDFAIMNWATDLCLCNNGHFISDRPCN